MIAPDLQQFLDRPTTQQFLSAAGRFVALIENKDISLEEYMSELHAALLDLYRYGHLLEDVGLKHSSPDTDFDRDTLLENLNARIVLGLGEEAFYWHVFDPAYDKDKAPSQGWLVDDIEDIYRDLKIELTKLKLDTSEAIEDAMYNFKWSHQHHWGQHCINALQYLHYYCYDGKQVVV